MPKNQHTQWTLLNFKTWDNGELLKIGHHVSNIGILKLMLSKNVLLNWYEKKLRKILMIVEVEN